jgi:hypothetical protein
VRTLLSVVLLVAAAASDRPVRPGHEAGCRTKADCAFTHYDEGCCWECGVTVGSASWVAAVTKACEAHPGRHCRTPACGQAAVNLACVERRCVNAR